MKSFMFRTILKVYSSTFTLITKPGGNERIVILDKIPSSQVGTVPVYLQEKPPQDCRTPGVRSNTLFFRYARPEIERSKFNFQIVLMD